MSEHNHVVTKDHEMSADKVEQAIQRMDGAISKKVCCKSFGKWAVRMNSISWRTCSCG